MRLLFVCPDMHRGGAERHWATLIPALARRGAEVRLVCLYREGPLFAEVRAAGVAAECLHLRGPADLRGARRALAEWRGRPGAVVTRTASPQLVGQAVARRAGAVHVFNEHTPLTPAGELLELRPHQVALTRLVAPHVDRVIAVSEPQAAPLARLGYCEDRIVTVPNGVFPADVQTRVERAEMRASLGLGERDFAVLCLANLRPEKGADAFAEAVGRARAGGAHGLRGLIAGDGPERERLERLVADVDGVELLGSRGDVPDLIAACDALALLSQAEALPMSVLEAMALGRPVIATDVGGTREAVAGGETGIVVAPGDTSAAVDALARLAADPARAQAMGERGRARQRERFDGEAMVEGYWRALAEVATR
jgi:glycosyltransferase involved in cell wall biosynthesis